MSEAVFVLPRRGECPGSSRVARPERWWLLACLLAWLFLPASGVAAAPPLLDVPSTLIDMPVVDRGEVLRDPSRELSLEQARAAKDWRAPQGSALHFGISRAVWWFRLTVRNPDRAALSLVLDTGSTQQDAIAWFLVSPSGRILSQGRMGDRIPFGLEPRGRRALALPFSLSPGQTVTVYLRFGTHDGLYDFMPLQLFSREAFSQHLQHENFLLTLFHGGLLVLVLVSVALLLMIQDRVILYYTLYLVAFLTYSNVASAFDLLYLWPAQTRLHNALALASGLLALVFGNAFGMTLAQFKQHLPAWLWRTLQLLLGCTLLGLLPVCDDAYVIGFYWASFGLALTLITCAIAAVLALRGVPGAQAMCVGFAVLIGGVSLNQLQLLGYAVSWNFTIGAIQFGAFLQILIFALALAKSLHRLAVAKMQAEAADQAKAAFLATMSHEIRTPLHAILGFAQLALQQEKNERQRGRLERILLAGRHLLGIINDILDFTKIDSGHLSLEHIPYDPRAVLSDIREMLGNKAAAKGLHLEVPLDAALPRALVGDPLRLRQILLNLTNNAIKFSQDGTIHVRLRPVAGEGGSLWLYGEVEDQGIGMNAEQAQKLFSPFTQADQSISRRFGGTGLGLAISKQLVEAMGGTIGLHSHPGAGCVFWFRIPTKEPDPTTVPVRLAPAPPEPVARERLHGRRVLLVDDNELNRLVSREFLESAGLAVDEAADGAQAIERLTKAPNGTYDLVLMDMMMPGLDGLEATRRLRARPRFAALPIIAMTANAGPEDAKRCTDAGMNAHLAKPINEQALWSTLARFLPDPPPSAAGPTRREEVLFDPRPLEELRDLTTPERFEAVLTLLLDDCRTRGERLAALARQGDLTALRQVTHDLIGSAGTAGFDRLLTLGRELRQALHADDKTRALALAEQIAALVPVAVEALQAHFHPAAERLPADETP